MQEQGNEMLDNLNRELAVSKEEHTLQIVNGSIALEGLKYADNITIRQLSDFDVWVPMIKIKSENKILAYLDKTSTSMTIYYAKREEPRKLMAATIPVGDITYTQAYDTLLVLAGIGQTDLTTYNKGSLSYLEDYFSMYTIENYKDWVKQEEVSKKWDR